MILHHTMLQTNLFVTMTTLIFVHLRESSLASFDWTSCYLFDLVILTAFHGLVDIEALVQ